jgi:hypothetical protein
MKSIDKRQEYLVKYISYESLDHVLKIYSERERVWRISQVHQSFGKVSDHDDKSLRGSETLVYEVYVGCSEPRHLNMQDE